jgi:hypothetical protein
MKKLCSMILVLASCLILTVPALAAEAALPAEAGASGYVVNPWTGGYVYTTSPWAANASYVVRPWETGYTYAMPANGTYVAAPTRSNYVYDTIWTNRAQGLANFQLVKAYSSGTFKDVPAGAWYEQGLKTLYERGLIGESKNFRPRSGMTLGEVVSLAVRMHSIYNNWSIPAGMSDLQYALNVGIVSADQYDNYNDPATRRSFAAIMAKALPSSALRGINAVMDGAIPDVPSSDPGAWAIYTLYRAGVLAGTNAWGTFAPNERITRDSAAVIAARILDPSQRQSNNLTVVQPASVSLSQSSLSLYPGESRTLAAYVYPAGTVSRNVYWTSSDYTVATVNANGTVTSLRPGTAIITAATSAGTVSACTVRVLDW